MSKRRLILYLCWLPFAGCLYFFENNTGTRIVLILSLLLPLIPALRRALFSPDLSRPSTLEKAAESVLSPAIGEDEGPGDVRPFLPGDPLNRVHWKLSAKRDELLVVDREKAADEAERLRAEERPAPKPAPSRRVRLTGCCLGAAALALILLFALPPARLGLAALLNRLYRASEAVNAYTYVYVPVPDGQPAGLAAALLAVLLAALACLTVLAQSRLPALAFIAAAALFQVYFGLSLPGWANAALFILLVLRLCGRPLRKKDALSILAVALAVSAAVLVFLPGTDPATEEASERARDLLSRTAEQLSGALWEAPQADREVRHAHTRSLTEGSGDSLAEREFRLVTREETQISMPRRLDLLRIALLLLLTAALVIVPFLPFVWLNARRKKAQERRKAFSGEDAGLAFQAIFQQVVRWLEVTGNGAGNVPYREWAPTLEARISACYAESFLRCEALFEQAAYSPHPLSDAQREQALDLLRETEEILWERARWKERFLIRYRECL